MRVADRLQDRALPMVLGYKAGARGLSRSARRLIIAKAVDEELPTNSPSDWKYYYGPPKSQVRYDRIVGWLKSLISLREHDPDKYGAALADWRTDLAWLRARGLAAPRRDLVGSWRPVGPLSERENHRIVRGGTAERCPTVGH